MLKSLPRNRFKILKKGKTKLGTTIVLFKIIEKGSIFFGKFALYRRHLAQKEWVYMRVTDNLPSLEETFRILMEA